MDFKITTTVDVSEQRVACLLCDAIESGNQGSMYWAEIEAYVKPPVPRAIIDADEPREKQHIYEHIDYPLCEGGALLIHDKESAQKGTRRLDLKSIKKGLQVMAKKYPKHWTNFITKHDDAITGDVFLQCCLFGELIYG